MLLRLQTDFDSVKWVLYYFACANSRENMKDQQSQGIGRRHHLIKYSLATETRQRLCGRRRGRRPGPRRARKTSTTPTHRKRGTRKLRTRNDNKNNKSLVYVSSKHAMQGRAVGAAKEVEQKPSTGKTLTYKTSEGSRDEFEAEWSENCTGNIVTKAKNTHGCRAAHALWWETARCPPLKTAGLLVVFF
jgi:hypothetical protein